MSDVVYVSRDGENPELRYSLRTVENNVPHGVLWIFGGAPAWIDTDTVLHVKRKQLGSPYSSTRAHISAAVAHPDVSDPFMLWNDDFYAMQRIQRVLTMHRGPASVVLEQTRTLRTPWADGLRETVAMLKSIGREDPLSYDLHVPILIYKDQMRDALRLAETIRFRSDAVHLRTIYGNVDPLGGVEIEDPKLLRKNDPFPRGPWLSSNDGTFRSTVEPVLRYLFPDPSVYERN